MSKLKYFFISALCFLQTTFASQLPSPYNSLEDLLPFVNHGWYSNADQLHSLINNHNVKIIVEVGSWLGVSTMDLAYFLPPDGRVYAVDTWKGSPEHQIGQRHWEPFVPYLYEQFLSNIIHANLTDKIVPLRMESVVAASIFTIRSDLVYIDGDHSTEAVYNDLSAWYPFVKGTGILCGDDWTWDSIRAAVNQFARENNLTIESSGNFWCLRE